MTDDSHESYEQLYNNWRQKKVALELRHANVTSVREDLILNSLLVSENYSNTQMS